MMARLNKQLWKKHDDAEALLSLDRPLTDDEVQQVLTDWHPEARTNVGVAGAFFTPLALALDVTMLATYNGGRPHYLDLCAGIGRLTWAMSRWHAWSNEPVHVTAVELNAEYVDVGRRVLRDVPNLTVDWVVGNAFDFATVEPLAPFHAGMSNPPFGKPKTNVSAGLRYTGAGELQAAEVIARTCTYGGILICGAQVVPWRRSLAGAREEYEGAKRVEYEDWRRANDGWYLERTSLDPLTEAYQFDVGVSFEIAEIDRIDGAYGVLAELAGLPLFEGAIA